MKQIPVRFSTLLLTFFIGVIAVWLISLLTIVPQPIETQPVFINEHSEEIPVTPISTVSAPKDSDEKPRFGATGRGCGFGYWQGYETDDGQQLSEGMSGFETRKKARSEFNKRIAKAVNIIEQGQRFRSHPGKVGERVVLINPADENGKETISIIWYGGGQFIAFINAPTLDLALEFEQFLEEIDYAAFGRN